MRYIRTSHSLFHVNFAYLNPARLGKNCTSLLRDYFDRLLKADS